MKSVLSQPVRGTREWAVATVDCSCGCSNDCRYCYARYSAVAKEKSMSEREWCSPVPIPEALEKEYPLYPGQVMFPAHHDIVPENLDNCIWVIKKLLVKNNRVLVVSKPNLQCVKALCAAFTTYKEQLLFRFTITARNPDVLAFWEPGAPSFNERMESLQLAFDNGYATSVSIEPMLDSEDVVDMVHVLLPFVRHSIWIGKMNKIGKRVVCDNNEVIKKVEALKNGQRDERIWEIYTALKDISVIRWKESVKKVVGLPLSQTAGEDR